MARSSSARPRRAPAAVLGIDVGGTGIKGAPVDLAALRGLSTGLERLAAAGAARGPRRRARELFRLRLKLAERLSRMAPSDPELSAAVAATRARLAELDAALAV